MRNLGPGYTRGPEREEAIDNLERVGRVDLAAAFRLAVRSGLHEGIGGSVAAAFDDLYFLERACRTGGR